MNTYPAEEIESALDAFEQRLGEKIDALLNGAVAPNYGARACDYCAYGALCGKIA
ncbi:MAG: PD-(D/E)XK nuclease family protein [Deltaproteobacteria bacterium]|nr:PD-(D/E)XK nuclease family protein [Deltaproteobacteria bacterium]